MHCLQTIKYLNSPQGLKERAEKLKAKEENKKEMYEVVRFFKNASNKVIINNVSKAFAMEWCQRSDTEGKNWIDGFRRVA